MAALATLAAAAVALAPTLNSLQGPVGDPTGSAVDSGSGSRVKLYASLDELLADSAAVVDGTVLSEEVDDAGNLVSTIEVSESFSPSGLAANVSGSLATATGSLIAVTTFGSLTSGGSASLAVGQNYLLFLTPTGLPGAGEDEFFITGVDAGLYVADGDRYRRSTTSGDTLPAELTVADLSA